MGKCRIGSCGLIHSLTKELEGIVVLKALAVKTSMGTIFDPAAPLKMSKAALRSIGNLDLACSKKSSAVQVRGTISIDSSGRPFDKKDKCLVT